jgi:hypothetical protein
VREILSIFFGLKELLIGARKNKKTRIVDTNKNRKAKQSKAKKRKIDCAMIINYYRHRIEIK